MDLNLLWPPEFGRSDVYNFGAECLVLIGTNFANGHTWTYAHLSRSMAGRSQEDAKKKDDKKGKAEKDSKKDDTKKKDDKKNSKTDAKEDGKKKGES